MNTRAIISILVVLVSLPAVGLGTQFGRGRAVRRMNAAGAGALQPGQVWRLTTLTLEQRVALLEVQQTLFRELRDGDRRAAMGRLREVQAEVTRILTPAQLEAARAMPRGPLAPEEVVYYPITALADLDPARRAKIDAVFRPVLDEARRDASGIAATREERREERRSPQRQRAIAAFEVLEALLTRDQMIAVKQFLPERIREAGLRERIVYRLPSLTLEQEAQARAIFAALEDETAADRARLKALRGESAGRAAGRDERREVASRVEARERQAHAELAKVLTPEQMKELAAQRPGPPRPVAFTPEAIRSLSNVTPEQRRRIVEAMQAFQRATRDERAEARDLREQVKGSDPQSMELAGVRDQLRRAGEVLDVERDRLVRTVADTLTGEQLAQLVMHAAQSRSR
jgi:hypothetical protein